MYGLAREVQTGSDKEFLNADLLAHLIMTQWRAQADNVDDFAYGSVRRADITRARTVSVNQAVVLQDKPQV